MSELTKILSDEHKNILTVIDVLENEAEALKNGKELDNDFLKKAVDFIRNYADKFHHAKEEEILFKELCKDSTQENMHCNPVGQMLIEHDLGRENVKKMEAGLNEKNKNKIIEGANGYICLIKEHIFKEDNILYPMANEALSESTKDKMLKKFKEIENERKKIIKPYLDFISAISKNE